MTPALPKRLFVGLPTPVRLATLVLALAGSTSSESLPLPPTRVALGLEQLIPDLPATLLAEPDRAPTPQLALPIVAPPDLAELRRVVAGRYLETLPFGDQIRRAARSQRIDGLLVASVVEAESSFRPDAVSDKGALGLMQLMPQHLEGVEQPLDPATNLRVGSSYLSRLARAGAGRLPRGTRRGEQVRRHPAVPLDAQLRLEGPRDLPGAPQGRRPAGGGSRSGRARRDTRGRGSARFLRLLVGPVLAVLLAQPLLEVPDPLAETSAELRDLGSAEQDHEDQQDDQELGETDAAHVENLR